MHELQRQPSSLHWQDAPMPDANAGVRLAPLHSWVPDHFWALVVFPAGWQRLRPGHYGVDEDFLVLQGDLAINEHRWEAQEHGFVPAQALRERTYSEQGCLACARFHGPPRWRAGSAGAAPLGGLRRRSAWSSTRAQDLHGHGVAHMVFEHQGLAHWVVPPSTLNALSQCGVRMDAFDLRTDTGTERLAADSHRSANAAWHWVCLPSQFV